jgi:hypothetical protein
MEFHIGDLIEKIKLVPVAGRGPSRVFAYRHGRENQRTCRRRRPREIGNPSHPNRLRIRSKLEWGRWRTQIKRFWKWSCFGFEGGREKSWRREDDDSGGGGTGTDEELEMWGVNVI